MHISFGRTSCGTGGNGDVSNVSCTPRTHRDDIAHRRDAFS